MAVAAWAVVVVVAVSMPVLVMVLGGRGSGSAVMGAVIVVRVGGRLAWVHARSIRCGRHGDYYIGGRVRSCRLLPPVTAARGPLQSTAP